MSNKEAIKLIWTGFRWITINCANAVDRAVHRCPYIFIVMILIVCIIVGYVHVGLARAERDKCLIELYHAQQQIDSLMIQTKR